MSSEMSSPAAIGVVGTGSVAQALGRLLYTRGAPIVAVTGRTPSRAREAAAFIGRAVVVLPCTDFARKVSRVLIAISDAEITPVAERLADAGLRHSVVLHTCGARGPEALAPLRASGNACGVCHPLQTVLDPQQGVDGLPGVAFGISGDGEARLWAEEIAAMLGGWTLPVDATSMAAYHAGAVILSNSQPALVEGALQAWAEAGIDRSTALAALGPLSRNALDNALRLGPEGALTGPVARGDAATVRAHVAALTSAPAHVDTLYRAVAQTLLVLARRRGLGEVQLQEVAGVLDAGAAE